MLLQMIITYDDQTGSVNVTGPVDNKGMSYLMLECARDAIKDHTDNVQRTAVPNNGIGGFVRRVKPKR